MKVAPLLRAIEKHNANHQSPVTIRHILVHTGQHYDYEMSQVFFQDLELPKPDVYLGVGSGTHAEQTAKVMIEFEKVLLKEKSDLVIVVGDVNSTLAAALAAVKLHIPIAHIEAGLRSYDRAMPEEINRILTDQVSDYLFTPSPDADENLSKEGILQEKIFCVGDVMVDSLLYHKPQAEQSQILSQLSLNKQGYALVTLHRPSNVDDKQSLSQIMAALKEIANRIPIVFPAHPRTQKRLRELNLAPPKHVISSKAWQSQSESNLIIIPPLGYLDFLNLEMNAKFVMTDSGGIQEETTVLNIPCLTMRDTTERPITLTQGTNTLVWNDTSAIIREAFKILNGKTKKGKCPELWDGKAAERIMNILAEKRKIS